MNYENSKNKIIMKHYKENTSPLECKVSVWGETYNIDVDDVKDFLIENKVGHFALKL